MDTVFSNDAENSDKLIKEFFDRLNNGGSLDDVFVLAKNINK